MAAGMIGPFSKLKYPLQINHIYNAEEIMESLNYEDNENSAGGNTFSSNTRLYRISDASIDHPDWKNENTSVNT